METRRRKATWRAVLLFSAAWSAPGLAGAAKTIDTSNGMTNGADALCVTNGTDGKHYYCFSSALNAQEFTPPLTVWADAGNDEVTIRSSAGGNAPIVVELRS